MYDGIIVGGGHAGCEAALAMARMGKKTLLITSDINYVASLPCNPSIGGPAKGVVVREIDALGGQMAITADQNQIQMKLLNISKGPAVRALRAQIDKITYPKAMAEVLLNTKNLEILEKTAQGLITNNNIIEGIVLEDGTKVYGKKVIITTGTSLNSLILVGDERVQMGPDGTKQNAGISHDLEKLGFEITRLKTGTPPRLLKSSINYDIMQVQKGDDDKLFFSHFPNESIYNQQVDCYLTHTNINTHQVINDNLSYSPLYSGDITGKGPRYCPSIEDKVVKFSDKNSHQVFVEPESLTTDDLYVQGLSTSLPRWVQRQIVKSVPGLENAKITRYGYAIEYDGINPISLYPTLETKLIKNLYTAGQINGTSGYEEAACQGLIAGINAALSLDNKEPLILKRNEAYIGVLIDDLITKGADEPYRLLTSRAEYRLLLRNDNADLRLGEYGYQVGLLPKEKYDKFIIKKNNIEKLISELQESKITPNKENLKYFEQFDSAPFHESVTLAELLKRPEVDGKVIKPFISSCYDESVIYQAALQIKYAGYINKAVKEAERMLSLESKKIPEDLDYKLISNLSFEAREKLIKIRPRTIGQATRILGVNPADIQILNIYLEARRRQWLILKN